MQKFKFYAGFNHQVMWGEGNEFYGDVCNLSFIETYLHVIAAKPFSNGDISEERPGNHLGSIDLGFDLEFSRIKIMLYRRNFNETGALGNLANIQDGLNGFVIRIWISWERKPTGVNFFKVFVHQKPGRRNLVSTHDSSYDGYYNHGQIFQAGLIWVQGWEPPLLLPGSTPGLVWHQTHVNTSINNRLVSITHRGAGALKSVEYLFKASWSPELRNLLDN
ncbi:MAG: hypothetical protein U5L72_06690 [Bacteroidales bacterium]|nr:hypothetical protein [Bacteroidales bacterium]